MQALAGARFVARFTVIVIDGLVDIDVLIGEPEVVGRGVWTRAGGLLLDRLRADPSVTYLGVGMSASNERAIRAAEKAGFRLFWEFQDPDSGPCRYMILDVGRSPGLTPNPTDLA